MFMGVNLVRRPCFGEPQREVSRPTGIQPRGGQSLPVTAAVITAATAVGHQLVGGELIGVSDREVRGRVELAFVTSGKFFHPSDSHPHLHRRSSCHILHKLFLFFCAHLSSSLGCKIDDHRPYHPIRSPRGLCRWAVAPSTSAINCGTCIHSGSTPLPHPCAEMVVPDDVMEFAESEEASSEPTAISDADDTPRSTGMVRVLHHGFFVLLTSIFQAVGLAGDHILTQVGSPVAVVDLPDSTIGTSEQHFVSPSVDEDTYM